MRITTSMVQRNVLSDLNTLQAQLARTQSKAASNKEITRPSDDPFQTSRAMGLRSNLGANEQFVRNIEDAQGWMDTTESSLDSITQYVNRAHDLLVRGATDTADATSRKAIAAEIDQIIEGIKETANATYGDRFVLSGTATSTPPYQLGANDAYQGNEAGWDPAIPGIVREIGPGVTVTINAVAREILGDGGANPTDGKLLNAAARHLHPPEGQRRRRPARRRHDRAQGPAGLAARGARPQRLADEPPRVRDHAPGPALDRADRPAFEDRRRGYREDPDRLQLAERGLPGGIASGREHRAVVANGFPALSRYGS